MILNQNIVNELNYKGRILEIEIGTLAYTDAVFRSEIELWKD